MSEDEQVAKIKAWFAERGYELVVHPVAHGGYFAPWLRADSQGGNAPFTWGQTAIEAAAAAQAQYEAEHQ